MQNLSASAPSVNPRSFSGITRLVVVELMERASAGLVCVSARAIGEAIRFGTGAILRVIRRLIALGLLERIGARTSSSYRISLSSEPPTPAPPPPPPIDPSPETAPEPPATPSEESLSRTEIQICYAVRNARDEQLYGSSRLKELHRGPRTGEAVPGGFSSVARARIVTSWVLAMADQHSEFWGTIANHLGTSYVIDERRRGKRGIAERCPIDWLAFDGGRGVLSAASAEWDRRRRLERERAQRRAEPAVSSEPISPPENSTFHFARDLVAKIAALAGLT